MNTVYLKTPWIELYRDMPHVRCVKPYTTLRTQIKNMSRHTRWWSPPSGRADVTVAYGSSGIIDGMSRSFRMFPSWFDAPDFGRVQSVGKYALLRPVTVRKEWAAKSRNPLPEYVAEAARILRSEGYLVVSVADLQDGEEWLVGETPEADITYHAGELSVEQLMALTNHASVVVGGVGWIVPAAIAYRKNAWIILGGQGGNNAPQKITSPRMDLSGIQFAMPDKFCTCTSHQHNCDKRISNHADKFTDWLRKLPPVVS